MNQCLVWIVNWSFFHIAGWNGSFGLLICWKWYCYRKDSIHSLVQTKSQKGNLWTTMFKWKCYWCFGVWNFFFFFLLVLLLMFHLLYLQTFCFFAGPCGGSIWTESFQYDSPPSASNLHCWTEGTWIINLYVYLQW